MEKQNYSITINAPKEKVWKNIIGDKSYRIWTEPFMPGSHYSGEWKAGNKMLFLAPEKDGTMSGMVSRIKEIRLYEFISIEHLGVVKNGKEDTEGEEAKKWGQGSENYTLMEKDGKTEMRVDLMAGNMPEEFKEMFEDAWPKALQKLKELSEKE